MCVRGEGGGSELGSEKHALQATGPSRADFVVHTSKHHTELFLRFFFRVLPVDIWNFNSRRLFTVTKLEPPTLPNVFTVMLT